MSDDLGQSVLAAADAIEQTLGSPPADASLALCPEGEDTLVHQLIYSLLLWESSHESAGKSLDAFRAELTGYNELRVCSADEIAGMLPREPKRDERAARLVASLNDVFEKHHGLSLATVAATPKREARQALDTIHGLPAFAASRMMLLTLGGHAFPLDDRLAAVLGSFGIEPAPNETATEFAGRLERAVRAADAPRVYALLELQSAAGINQPKVAARKPARKSGKTKAGQDT